MEQIYGNRTAPTFSFNTADPSYAWECFHLTAQDYLELLRIKPQEEDQQKRGWEQITKMFIGGKQTDTSKSSRQQHNYRNTSTNTDPSTASYTKSN